MFNRIVIKPHAASDSAKALVARIRELTGERNSALLLKHEGSRYNPRDTDVFFNYGDSRLAPDFTGAALVLNTPDSLARTTNKLTCLGLMSDNDVPTIAYTSQRDQAQAWFDAGNVVYARTKLQGHSGDGIVVCSAQGLEDVGGVQVSNALVDAPLYTLGIQGSRREYRVHVMNDTVVYAQLKRRRNEYRDNPEYSNVVRNFHTGWIYSTQNMVLPDSVRSAAQRAVAAAGLYFGAVDVIQQGNNAFVLEINTAPGMTGTTLETYAQNLLRIRDGQAPTPLNMPAADEVVPDHMIVGAEVAEVIVDELEVEAPMVNEIPAPEVAPLAGLNVIEAANILAGQGTLPDRSVYRDTNGDYWQYRSAGNYIVTFGVDIRVKAPDNFPEGFQRVV